MSGKTALSPETLSALGIEKLAQLVLDEMEINPAFKKLVKAALASLKGPQAVAKVIDRRLAALERGRAMIAWEKERAFAEDLDATVATLVKELAPLSPALAVERLVRFIEGHGAVLDRIDDSSGRIQGVYWRACEAMTEVVRLLAPPDAARLPVLLTRALDKEAHGLVIRTAIEVAPLLPAVVLAEWERLLAAHPARDEGRGYVTMIRQAVADARGDLDAYIALEARLPLHRQDALRVAERLLAARRLEEALVWVDKPRKGGIAFATVIDVADGQIKQASDQKQLRLKADILEAMKDRPAAQAVRWAAFEDTLEPDILREYIGKLDDFQEFDELDRAFALVAASPRRYGALAFFLEWPRRDLAARLVLDHAAEWDGRHYEIIGKAAADLELDHPLAAIVLYRSLLNDILARGKSVAYGHGARYLAKLGELAGAIPEDAPGLESHDAYALRLRKEHGRKSGFWSQVDGDGRR